MYNRIYLKWKGIEKKIIIHETSSLKASQEGKLSCKECWENSSPINNKQWNPHFPGFSKIMINRILGKLSAIYRLGSLHNSIKSCRRFFFHTSSSLWNRITNNEKCSRFPSENMLETWAGSQWNFLFLSWYKLYARPIVYQPESIKCTKSCQIVGVGMREVWSSLLSILEPVTVCDSTPHSIIKNFITYLIMMYVTMYWKSVFILEHSSNFCVCVKARRSSIPIKRYKPTRQQWSYDSSFFCDITAFSLLSYLTKLPIMFSYYRFP